MNIPFIQRGKKTQEPEDSSEKYKHYCDCSECMGICFKAPNEHDDKAFHARAFKERKRNKSVYYDLANM